MRSSLNPLSLAIATASVLLASAASAATIYVAPNGTNTATCGTSASPCKTLQQGHTRVDAGGTVLLTQPGDYGSAVISKPLNILGVPGAGIFSPTTPCLTVNMAGGSDVLSVTGLTCNMDGASRDGILINAGHKTRLDNVAVRGNRGNTCGVRSKPTTGTTELMITNSSFTENGTSGNGGGICAVPESFVASPQVIGVIRNTVLQNGRHGLYAGANGSGALTRLVLDNVDASQNQGGIFALGPNSQICIRNSTISGNTIFGLGGGGTITNGGGNLVVNGSGNAFTGGCP